MHFNLLYFDHISNKRLQRLRMQRFLKPGTFWRKYGIQRLHCDYLIPRAYISFISLIQVSQNCNSFF